MHVVGLSVVNGSVVAVTSKAPRLNVGVGSTPTMLNLESGVQNLTISFSVQSNTNTIIGYGAPLTNASEELFPSSLHIMRENIGSNDDTALVNVMYLLSISRESSRCFSYATSFL